MKIPSFFLEFLPFFIVLRGFLASSLLFLFARYVVRLVIKSFSDTPPRYQHRTRNALDAAK